MRLSILICTIFERADNFAAKIMKELRRQRRASKHKDVIQLLSLGDDPDFTDSYQMSIGEKRNHLIALAKGQYVCFIDDDDMVAPDYIDQIFEGMRLAPGMDCYNFKVAYSDGRENKNVPVYYSMKYDRDNDVRSMGHVESYERMPNHLMVIKLGIAEQIKFREINKGEDTYWAREVRQLLKSEHCIDKTLYWYNWNVQTTVAQKR